MKTHHIFFFFLFVILFSACEDEVEFNPKEGKPALVVEGWLTDKPESHYVKLYYTKAINNNEQYTGLSNATLVLSDGETEEQLQEVSAGLYEIASIRGEKGKTYTLSINTGKGSYKAVSVMPRLSMRPDSLTFKYEKESIVYEYEGYYPFIHGQELAGTGDYVRVKLFRNGKHLNRASDINLLSDEFVDGNYISSAELEIDSTFVQGDLARAEVWSLTEHAYRFWRDIQTQLNNGAIYASPLANSRTNIKKENSSSEDVIGYFGTSLVASVETKIQ